MNNVQSLDHSVSNKLENKIIYTILLFAGHLNKANFLFQQAKPNKSQAEMSKNKRRYVIRKIEQMHLCVIFLADMLSQ